MGDKQKGTDGIKDWLKADIKAKENVWDICLAKLIDCISYKEFAGWLRNTHYDPVVKKYIFIALTNFHNDKLPFIKKLFLAGFHCNVLIEAYPFIYDFLTGFEFIKFIMDLQKIPFEDVEERVNILLNLFSLKDEKDYLIKEYSHGMKRKVALISLFEESNKAV